MQRQDADAGVSRLREKKKHFNGDFLDSREYFVENRFFKYAVNWRFHCIKVEKRESTKQESH